MGIAGDKPRQLAPIVGTTGSGSTDSPAPSPTTAKIDIDTVIGIAASTNVDTTTKIDIDTIVGIPVPAVVDVNPADPEVDAIDSTVIDSVSLNTANLASAVNVIGPTSGTTGTALGGYDMAFGLFNFRVDSSGAMELLSIGDCMMASHDDGNENRGNDGRNRTNSSRQVVTHDQIRLARRVYAGEANFGPNPSPSDGCASVRRPGAEGPNQRRQANTRATKRRG
jgi:hypothetical protein